MPIRVRLAVIFAAATALAAAIFGYVFVSELSDGLRSSLRNTIEVRATAILQELPDSGRVATLQLPDDTDAPVSKSVANRDSELLTQLVGPRGGVVDSTGPDTAGAVLSADQLRRARTGQVVAEGDVGPNRQHFLLVATAVPDHHGVVLVVGQSLATVDQATSGVETAIVAGGIAAVIAAGVAAWFLARFALSPVERMRRQAEVISARDSGTRLTVPRSRDEIARLAETLNALIVRLHGALDRQRGFATAAGHELRTPLALVKAELELAGRPGRDRTYLAAAVTRAAAEVDRVIELANRLLLLSELDERGVGLDRAPADLATLVAEALSAHSPKAATTGATIRLRAPDHLVARVDRTAYRQVVDNLVDNALRHGRPGGTVEVRLRQEADRALLEVADDGPGFPEEFVPHAFERFARADHSRSRASGGAGLGLAIVKVLSEAHGGAASAGNGPDGGGLVTAWVPLGPGDDRGPSATTSHGVDSPALPTSA